MSQEIDMFIMMRLPFPWPPPQPSALFAGPVNGQPIELIALTDGRIELKTKSTVTSFVSQPLDVLSDRPAWASIRVAITAVHSIVEVSGQSLLPDGPNVPRLPLTSAQGLVPQEFSIYDSNKDAACQTWINNRKSKFATQRTPATNRRRKTIGEQAHDLIVSIYRLRALQQQVLARNSYLLGTLAGEMRASVFWKQDAQPDRSYNPLLLRMANLAQLPLPVYVTPSVPLPRLIMQAQAHVTVSHAPRIERMFVTDRVCDLQEALESTIIRLGQSPNDRIISASDSISELANTMGAAHYDESASEFLDFLHQMKVADSDQLSIFMCQIAEVLASLSEWVIEELKTRNIIS